MVGIFHRFHLRLFMLKPFGLFLLLCFYRVDCCFLGRMSNGLGNCIGFGWGKIPKGLNVNSPERNSGRKYVVLHNHKVVEWLQKEFIIKFYFMFFQQFN